MTFSTYFLPIGKMLQREREELRVIASFRQLNFNSLRRDPLTPKTKIEDGVQTQPSRSFL
jgi:hypothetical protein